MKLKLMVAVAVMAAVPLCAQAQQPKAPQAQQQPAAPKPTKAAAQKVVQLISADKAKTAKYCELASLGDEMEAANQKKDTKKLDELAKKADALMDQVGPEYAALMDGFESLDQNSKDAQEIGAILEGLEKLCAKK
jgi:hypothetical protein